MVKGQVMYNLQHEIFHPALTVHHIYHLSNPIIKTPLEAVHESFVLIWSETLMNRAKRRLCIIFVAAPTSNASIGFTDARVTFVLNFRYGDNSTIPKDEGNWDHRARGREMDNWECIPVGV